MALMASVKKSGISRSVNTQPSTHKKQVAIAMIAAVAVLGCFGLFMVPPASGQAYLPSTVTDAIDAALFLTQFKEALETAGLLEQFNDPEWNGTLLAPTDLGMEAYFAATNTTLQQLEADNNTLSTFLNFHIIPGAKYFPLSTLRDGIKIPTASGLPITVDRSTPGIVHLWGSPKDTGVTNFATILQYQEVAGNKAVLYVIDKPLTPTPPPPTAPPAPPKRG